MVKELLNLFKKSKNSQINFNCGEFKLDSFESYRQTILIIDDSPGMVEIIKEHLTTLGYDKDNYNIVSFTGRCAPFSMINGLKQLENLGLEKIDYAIIDLILPGKVDIENKMIGMDGIDVASYLDYRFNCKNSCIIHVEGFDTESGYNLFFNKKIEKFRRLFRKDLKDFLLYKEIKGENFIKELNLLFKEEKYILNEANINSSYFKNSIQILF
jgi:CheY-like chemotaxis protein